MNSSKERLLELYDGLGEQERSVLVRIAERLTIGQAEHGHLDLANDPRNWNLERFNELLDVLMYREFEALQAELKKRDTIRCPPPDGCSDTLDAQDHGLAL